VLLTRWIVWRDVENIEPLTKEEMLEFYRNYVHPDSPSRAKATVYLMAQSSAADLAAKTSSSEKREKLVETLSQMLEQLGLEDTNTIDLTKRLESVDLAAGDAKDIMAAVGGYLKESAGMAAEQVDALVEQGQTVLASVLPSLGIVPKAASEEATMPNGEVEANGETAVKKTVVIEDVKAFKASMPLSAGVRPVKDLSEFEELGAKL
jgi:insulysin